MRGKIFFELEGIRQAAYVWVNGEPVGYYEAGIAAMGFDLTNYVTPGEQALIAICNDGLTGRGTSYRIPYETVPGEKWGSSYTPDNYKTTVGGGTFFQWNTQDFNEPQIGLVYNAYLHVKGDVYQTLPLYNNLKTTGNYIYADNFDIKAKTADITVDAEVRNESAQSGDYTLEVVVADAEGNMKYSFESNAVTVAAAEDAGVVYETAVEPDTYQRTNHINATVVNTPDVTHITASCHVSGLRFWSTEDPYLYTVYTVLKDADGNAVDVEKKKTGFRKVTYDPNSGILINDRAVWLTGYAQRATNEWAVIGSATDWLQDYDMSLVKENNSNFIRWMHVAPKPAQVRSSDKYGVAIACPAGDKENAVDGRQWSQRVEALRDVMIYYRNSPSVIFWETGNSAVGTAEKADEMASMRDKLDSHGMRFIGARSTLSADQLNYDYNYAGTMYGTNKNNESPKTAIESMKSNGKPGPIMETEYARNESPRRVWDIYSPPDFDYVNKQVYRNGSPYKKDGYDYWSQTQEEASLANIREYDGYYSNRAGIGDSIYSAAAMMIWSDSNMHTRNAATENCRTSGRVDPIRQKKEMFEATRAAQSSEPAVHILGHWSYPELTEDTYNFFETQEVVFETVYDENGNVKYIWSYDEYTDKKGKRNPLSKTVYVIGSSDVAKVELYRTDNGTQTLIGTDSEAESSFIYQFDNIDVTQGDGVIAKAYDARGTEIASDEIARTGKAAALRLIPHTAVKKDENGNSAADWRADGSDIAYIDVEVIDENGNVCALNYDKISFSYSGEGVYLGGYNGGSGGFQNRSETEGLSSYFGGDKSGESTLGKNYVYAENGTNRIFIRSTRNAGAFTLNASLDGMMPVSVTINSNAVETNGGLTTQQQSELTPGLSEPPTVTTVAPLKPLMLTKHIIPWATMPIITEKDNTVYYDITLNGSTLNTSARAYIGVMDTLFGPIYEMLCAAQEAGNDRFTMTYDSSKPETLVVTKDGHTYEYQEGSNQILIDGTERTECVDTVLIKNGTMVANLPLMLGSAGVEYEVDSVNHIINLIVK